MRQGEQERYNVYAAEHFYIFRQGERGVGGAGQASELRAISYELAAK